MKKNCFTLMVCCSVFWGCAATQKVQTQDLDQYHIWISQTAAIKVEESYLGDQVLYIKYQAFFKDSNRHRVFYGRGIWEDDPREVLLLAHNLVVPFEFISLEQWQERPEDLSPIKSLDEEHWKAFRHKLVHQLTPQEINQGAVVRSAKDELILYYDENDHLSVKDIKDKPVDVKIKKIYGPAEMSDLIIETLRDYLVSINQETNRVLMTSFNDDYANSFIYVDLESQFSLSLDTAQEQKIHYKQSLIRKGIKSADLLILDSHIIAMLTRPFSSTFRLFSITKEVAYDVINPNKIRIIENSPVPPINEGDGMDLTQWDEELDKIVGRKALKGNVDFLVGGDEFFPRLIDAFIGAKETIDVRIFIFDNDDYAVKIADILKKRSNEGIKVRVLLDGMGVIMGEGKISDDLPAGFIPPDSMIKYLTKDSKVEVRVRPSTWFKADHIKTIIIDNHFGFTGGMNIGREYRYEWHDMMMRIKGPIVSKITKEFHLAWEHSGRLGDMGYLKAVIFDKMEKIEEQGYPVRLLYTRLNHPEIFKAQIAAIRAAKKYIYITNAYFSDNSILYEIIKARRRGVDVRVILPIDGNHEIMNKSNRVTANTMFKNGIRVFFYPGMSHVKAAIYDGWVCTGTANFDRLSFRDNLELNLAISDVQAAQQYLDRLFIPDFEKSREMTELIEVGLREHFASFLAERL